MGADHNRFANLNFEDFRRLANDDSLSKYEKIGFPDSYRAGKEEAIFEDIVGKLPALNGQEKTILDVGPGCSDLPKMLINLCESNSHRLILVDSEEMLRNLPESNQGLKKVAAIFPACPDLIKEFEGRVDAILCYSVLQYVIVDASFLRFIDISLALLAPGGRMLIGDIPNISKRKRFFASETGIEFHRNFMKTTDVPQVIFNQIEHDQIDDSVVMLILQRARSQGFDAYVVPQAASLPMANRREDILICRP